MSYFAKQTSLHVRVHEELEKKLRDQEAIALSKNKERKSKKSRWQRHISSKYDKDYVTFPIKKKTDRSEQESMLDHQRKEKEHSDFSLTSRPRRIIRRDFSVDLSDKAQGTSSGTVSGLNQDQDDDIQHFWKGGASGFRAISPTTLETGSFHGFSNPPSPVNSVPCMDDLAKDLKFIEKVSKNELNKVQEDENADELILENSRPTFLQINQQLLTTNFPSQHFE